MKTRHNLDAYYTHQKLVEQLLLKYSISTNKVILEPCSGKGHISNYLKVLGYEVITNDIDIDVEANTHHDMTADISHLQLTDLIDCDVVITNSPFNVANKILENCLEVADEVVILLRLSFIEPCKSREAILSQYKDNLVKVIPVSPRPQFRTDTKGSDSVTVAWFIWNTKFSWNKLGVNCPFDFITNWK